MKIYEIEVPVGPVTIKGNLSIPNNAESLVIFSHGSGSSRFSPRNSRVAERLNKGKIATLLIDLLTELEDSVFENRFNIDLLTDRLIAVTNYVKGLPDLKGLPVGYFGASTGAASALQAAIEQPDSIQVVVSRGGRPDLAKRLADVKAPTLLIVGSLDPDVIILNEQAYLRLTCEKKISIIEGATHLFEEPGTLDEVAELAMTWFQKHFSHHKDPAHVVSK